MKRRLPRVAHPPISCAACGAALAALLAAPLVPSIALGQGRTRTYTTGQSAVVLDGTTILVESAEGGTPRGEVVAERAGPDGVEKKRIGAVTYDDLTLTVGLDAKPVLDWVAASWDGKASTKSGSVVTTDAAMKATGEREFRDAAIAATTFPALDGSSREEGRLTVTIVPERVLLKPGSGERVQAAVAKQSQRRWLTSNFRFELDGLSTSRVARIEPFTVGSAPAAAATGARRELAPAAGAMRFPNLTVTFSQSDAKSWTDWHDSFLVQGKNGDEAEKNGAIVLLGPDQRSEIGRVALSNCGIVRLAPASGDGPRAMAMMTAEIYCERMAFTTGK